MKTNKNLDRIDKIFFDAMDYVEEREGAAFLKLCDKYFARDDYDDQYSKYLRQNAIDFAEMIETDMYAEGIITTVDYEMYGDKVSTAVTVGVSSLIQDYVFLDKGLRLS